MNVFMIGGTGLLGSAAAAELIARGHQVKSIALPPPAGRRSDPGGDGNRFGELPDYERR